ncbi:hypothetical protein P3X46_013856 [Hevea brasiliensis]|uniref:Reverse transcriptase zinc-binding domain-containing protein n=1 Tax=Hevea brasiliensis TaxID=3981 RepID=A0ABQ9M514_HEVBR|nr:hypothetical protein P3X46_013856 [Hevea brasiliensis]
MQWPGPLVILVLMILRVDIISHCQLVMTLYFVDQMGIVDLGFRGTSMKWNNRRNGTQNIQEWIDCCFSSPQWFLAFPNVVVQHLEDQRSNHRPLLLDLDPLVSGFTMFNLISKLKSCKHALRWILPFGSVKEYIQILRLWFSHFQALKKEVTFLFY